MRAALLAGFVLAAAAGCGVRAAAVAPVGRTVLLPGRPADVAVTFVGSAACGECHREAYARWQSTGHARDYAGLPRTDRAVPVCLRCHVTGYGSLRGFGGPASPDLAAVGCEACHGPGADHARSRHPGLVPTATGGECPPCEANRICRLCHTPERSPGFDLAAALAQVSCGRAAPR